MSMRTLDELREKFCRELDEIAEKNDLNAGDLETVHKLTDTIKNIDKICLMDEEGYSGAGEWEARGRFGDSYDRGSSYANRGKHYVRGHYSRDNRGDMRGMRGGRSRDGRGYSGDDDRDEVIMHLEQAMEDAHGEAKEYIRKAINAVEKD